MPDRLPRTVALAFPFAALAAAGVLVAARWPSYWVWVAPEQTPMAFVEAILLFSAALFAALLALVSRIEAAPRREQLVWSATAVAFLYLTADERFALHERLRDNVLADTGVGLPWGSPGDYVLVILLLASLLVLPDLVRLLRGHPLAFRFFVGGVALATLVVAADTVDVQSMSLRVERVEQTLEEVVEGVAGSLLAAGLFLMLAARLAPLGRIPEAPTDDLPAALRAQARESSRPRARAAP
jgi:hypothetical protein